MKLITYLFSILSLFLFIQPIRASEKPKLMKEELIQEELDESREVELKKIIYEAEHEVKEKLKGFEKRKKTERNKKSLIK